MANTIETKVKAATAAAYLGSTALLGILTSVESSPSLVSSLPGWLAPFVLGVVPTAVTFVAGYQARHTPRADAAAAQSADIRPV